MIKFTTTVQPDKGLEQSPFSVDEVGRLPANCSSFRTIGCLVLKVISQLITETLRRDELRRTDALKKLKTSLEISTPFDDSQRRGYRPSINAA